MSPIGLKKWFEERYKLSPSVVNTDSYVVHLPNGLLVEVIEKENKLSVEAWHQKYPQQFRERRNNQSPQYVLQWVHFLSAMKGI